MNRPIKNSLQDLYIKGNKEMSISRWRNNLLIDFMNKQKDFKVAIRDIESNQWSCWKSPLLFNQDLISSCYDLHRSVLDNEIVLESDNPNYSDNVTATKYIGKILESKGYIPMYWYSGSKSIHCSIFIDFSKLFTIAQDLQKRIIDTFNSKDKFILEFMTYLRAEFISCFGLNTYEFDKAFLKPKHLIRSELSLNKKGFKTFLGYSYKDITAEPYICNVENREYPQTGELIESFDNNPNQIIGDFFKYYELVQQKRNLYLKRTKNQGEYKHTIRAGVKLLLSDEFTANEDGRKRTSFILCNELKQIYSFEEAKDIILSWNAKFKEPLREQDLIYRIQSPHKYKLTTLYINNFLKEFGYDKEQIDRFINK